MSAWGSFGGPRDFEDAQSSLGVFFALSHIETRLAAGSKGIQDNWVPVIPFAGSAGLILAEP